MSQPRIPLWEGRQPTDRLHVTQDQWSHYMPLIKRLYIDENHTLHDVMKIMRRDHDFHSSAKMYKLWLKRLGIRKNVRLQQQDIPYVLQLTSKASRAGPCGQVKLASGQVVDIERLASHLHRKRASPGLDALAGDGVDLDRFARAVCHYSGHNYALPPRIDEPDALRLPQLVLSDVESYIGSFGPGLGSVVLGLFTEPTLCSNYISMRFQVQSLDTSEPDPIMSIPPLARHVHLAIDTAAYFLANDEVDSAIAQLKIVPERIRLSLEGGGKEPPLTLALIWKVTLFLITSASTARPELEGIVRSLLKYIASIIGSSRTISPALRRIVNNLSDLYSIDGHLLNETAARGLAVYDKFFGLPISTLTSQEPFTTGYSAAARWLANFESDNWQAWNQAVRDFQGISAPEAVSALHRLVVLHQHRLLIHQRQGLEHDDDRRPNEQLLRAVEDTVRAVRDDLAVAAADREQHRDGDRAMANLSHAEMGPGVQNAVEVAAMRKQDLFLRELSALQEWLSNWQTQPEYFAHTGSLESLQKRA